MIVLFDALLEFNIQIFNEHTPYLGKFCQVRYQLLDRRLGALNLQLKRLRFEGYMCIVFHGHTKKFNAI